ncbi:MAG: TIGR03905 family TSCPD domain-containing protein [Clostridia bacterium]|nr:TIGR03905 family TSCPD domain-containing protein [Clostridia bacterium]
MFDLEDGKLSNVAFRGGCNGNLKAISKLVEGMDAEKVIELLEGNTCGFKNTSCADQLTVGIKKALEANS